MPQFVRIPKKLYTGDFSDVVVPSVGVNGYASVWNNTNQRAEWVQVEAAGAVAAHVALANPHAQYALASSLGTAAVLNVGMGANQIVQLTVAAKLPAVDGSLLTNLPTTAPGGSTTYVQYNNAGAFAGDAGMTYDAVNDALTVAGRVVTPIIRPSADGTAAVKITTASGADVVTVDTTGKNLIVENQLKLGSNRLSIQQHPSYPFQMLFNSFAVFSSQVGVCTTVNGTVTINAAIPTVGGAGLVIVGYPSGTGNFLELANSGGVHKFRVEATGATVIGQYVTSTAFIDIAPSLTDRAHLRLRSGVAPTTPNDGEIWYPTSGRLTFRRNTTTEIFATGVQGAGGAATAGATYTATEQAMLQKVYDIARTFGLLN